MAGWWLIFILSTANFPSDAEKWRVVGYPVGCKQQRNTVLSAFKSGCASCSES